MTGKTNLPLSIHEYELHSSECSTKFELTIQHAINTYAYLPTYIKKQKNTINITHPEGYQVMDSFLSQNFQGCLKIMGPASRK